MPPSTWPKGLEFPVVYVTGLEEGLFPIGESAFDEKELEEERRLAYVAITRARDILTLTAAASRKIYGRSHWNVPSRFVTEAGLIEAPSPRSAPPARAPWGQTPGVFSAPSRGGTNAPIPVGLFDPDEETGVPTPAMSSGPLSPSGGPTGPPPHVRRREKFWTRPAPART